MPETTPLNDDELDQTSGGSVLEPLLTRKPKPDDNMTAYREEFGVERPKHADLTSYREEFGVERPKTLRPKF
ncbi:MAG: hypothetical protein AAFR17_06600 [Pseudomonadota bacterium]